MWDPARKRSTTRVLAHLGPCDAEGKLLRPPRAHVEEVHSAFPVGPLAALYAAARELRVEDHLSRVLGDKQAGRLVLLLALNQATSRVASYRLGDWVEQTPLPRWMRLDVAAVTSATVPRALDALCHYEPGQGWEDRGLLAQRALTRAWRQGSREPAGAYYDVTKQPYYGSTCGHVQQGHDSQGSVNPVIGFGLVVSREHRHPILCRALPGAHADTLGVTDTLHVLKGDGIERVTMVVDRGMTSRENVDRIVKEGYDVVSAARGWTPETREFASRYPEQELERPEYNVATSHGHSVYARAFTGPHMGRRKMRLTVVENLWRKASEREARDAALRELGEGPVSPPRARELREELRGLVVPRRGRRGFAIDPDAVERDRALDGRFLLFGTDTSMDGATMYRTYFRRDAIEKCFRTGKGELSLGPIRYRRKDRVDAYATVFYLAYLLWSWAERRLQERFPDRTLADAFRSLDTVHWIRFGAGKNVRDWATRLTSDQRKVLSATSSLQYLPTR